MNKKKLILGIILGIILLGGTTYAIYTWIGKTIISGDAECFSVNYVKGRDIGSNENSQTLKLGDNFNDGLSSTVEVGLNSNCTITIGSGTLYLDVDDSTSDILLTSGALKYQVIDGNTFITNGTLTSKGRNIIYEDFKVTDINKAIIVIVWLDSNMVTDSNRDEILSSSFSGKINVKVESRRA